jgi:zona occludens toxin (predicted ATPase)
MLSANSMESRNFNFDFSTENGIKNIADMLRWNAAVNYNHRTEKTFDLNDVQYQQSTQPRDYRNKYTNQLDQQFKLSSEVSYNFGFRDISLRPGIRLYLFFP